MLRFLFWTLYVTDLCTTTVYCFLCFERQQQHEFRVISTASREDSSSTKLQQLIRSSWHGHSSPSVPPRTLLCISWEAALSENKLLVRTRKKGKNPPYCRLAVYQVPNRSVSSSSATPAANQSCSIMSWRFLRTSFDVNHAHCCCCLSRGVNVLLHALIVTQETSGIKRFKHQVIF